MNNKPIMDKELADWVEGLSLPEIEERIKIFGVWTDQLRRFIESKRKKSKKTIPLTLTNRLKWKWN